MGALERRGIGVFAKGESGALIYTIGDITSQNISTIVER